MKSTIVDISVFYQRASEDLKVEFARWLLDNFGLVKQELEQRVTILETDFTSSVTTSNGVWDVLKEQVLPITLPRAPGSSYFFRVFFTLPSSGNDKRFSAVLWHDGIEHTIFVSPIFTTDAGGGRLFLSVDILSSSQMRVGFSYVVSSHATEAGVSSAITLVPGEDITVQILGLTDVAGEFTVLSMKSQYEGPGS